MVLHKPKIVRHDTYNRKIATTPPTRKVNEFVLWLVAPIVIVVASLAVWLPHFEATFQADDVHVIVKNKAIQDLANIPRFFTTPLMSADQPEYAQYRPLAMISLALDYQLASPINPRVFDADSFAWFLLEVLLFFGLCRLLFGKTWQAALFATAVFLMHPVTGETLNYASRRGDILGAIGLIAGMAFWIVWPNRLPKEIVHFTGVPKTDWDDLRRRRGPEMNMWYRKVVEAPLGLYLIPVVLGMFADPDVAFFPLLILAYILLFDNAPGSKPVWRRVLPAAVVCFGFEALQLAFTWKYAAGYRMPAVNYWITEPLAAMRYLGKFFLPVHLTPETDLAVYRYAWEPGALAGFAGLAVLVLAAIWLSRKEQWRLSAFGIWWFLAALLPSMLIPQRMAESDVRLYLPMLGLAIAFTQAGVNLWRRLLAGREGRTRIDAMAVSAAIAVLAVLGVLTFQRNRVWSSEPDFRADVAEKSPRSGSAFLDLGVSMARGGQPAEGYKRVLHGAELIEASDKIRKDAADHVQLARTFDLFSRDAESEKEFKRAIEANPEYSTAWSAYSLWLSVRQRGDAAYDAATRALKLSPWNREAQHTMMQYYSDRSDWPNLKKAAEEVLKTDPADEDAKRSLSVVRSSAEAVIRQEEKAKKEPGVDQFLALSVQYYRAGRFDDAVRACKEAIKLRPDLAEAYSNMAASYYALKQNDNAIQALREAVRIRPDLEIARKNLNFLLNQKGEQAPASAVH